MSHPEGDPRHLETLDRDLARFSNVELAALYVSRPMVSTGVALIFVLMAGLAAALFFEQANNSVIVVVAACLGAYMALNIGANDVANNMGPAVGANALTMGGAIAIAVVFESAGALLAGGDVVSTIAKGIIAPESMGNATTFIWAMMAALLSAALWINLATWVGAPVSTTHSVVGGVMGAGIAAVGFAAVSWHTMSTIAASWVISPVLGGVVAALFLALIKSRIIYREDKIAAARTWVPVLVGIMAGAFAAYLALKGLSKVFSVELHSALLIGLVVGIVTWVLMIPLIRKQSEGLENRNKSLKVLFGIPLIVSAALLSFAHGANDVANAVGPLAAIVQASGTGSFTDAVSIPTWVMVMGAFGISFGLFLFGPKLIRMVGGQITKLNPMRAYCVALSAAITVILASWLGLPVSSTHIAVGGVFGVGFFREWDAERRIRKAKLAMPDRASYAPEERRRRKLVRRSHFMTIIAAWVITVPAAAILSAVIFFGIQSVAG
ncbi:inorganic phosphate transporter [Sulfitobacter pseudonitzschiae]|uniref:Phosphate transporter n=1 Tax=Pseudosulfitobacter pseudonitzschiae TaxID=1402135 RepID=A0A9Q2NS84_9RHOB|nr:inorganic phosphate transporter [Pseudosulfitobacter pseudonitzschiae]MBM2294166.1 inorganic phosphate transporter [Pseudosulfitobacter pseudonitzschiae]MBM2299090.1 inorganic phosphate transporter [Pseudosulfitobacter pseudonitzschiae]MBM2303998.1 inorganic phosphate transporter [Pseudosulfitobacter pseudonitzschiae]MBM2313779.1 inorganic phosphate transporter [Pseudosulfitobacter pseudonitzschiae]MBM2318694.1 inorganic phosphate transporter [Pseudosulfitobacter pseudonitzschiae]